MQRASCVSFSLLGRVRLSSASLALSLFDRRIHARVFSLLYLYSVVERRMKEEYARRYTKHTRVLDEGRSFVFFCFLKFPFLPDRHFLYAQRCFFCLVCLRWCNPKNLNFSHHVLKRRERHPLLLSKKDKKRRNTTPPFLIKNFILVCK